MPSVSPHLVETILAETIAHHFTGTEPGHCVRVDFFELPQIRAICTALQAHAPQVAIHVLGTQNDALTITTDRAIELRNRKQVQLCLFVPTDLVDAAFSSLANSFAILDGRALLHTALQCVRERLSPPVRAMVNDVVSCLRLPLRVSESQKIAFCQALIELEAQERLDEAGTVLWHVGLIADRGADFRARLDRNRRCVIKLAMPLKLQASLMERIASTNVDPTTTAQLMLFFRDRVMNDHVAWSQAMAAGHGPTFEQWIFPVEERSDLRSVTLQSFVDRQGKVTTHSKLKQPDGPGGALIAEYGDQAKGLSVKWVTDPPKPKNIGGWRVELVPVANPDDHDLDLPSRDLPASRGSATLKIELDFSGDEESLPDESFQVRLTALDHTGDVLPSAEDGQDLIALSEEFFIAKADEPISQGNKRETRPRTVANLALARLEVASETKADQLDEQEPLWTSRDLEYFSLRLDPRRKIMLGMSRLLKQLEERTLAEPLTFGRYSLHLSEIDEATSEQIEVLAPPALSPAVWQKFRSQREQLCKQLKGAEPRHLVSVAGWNLELARRAERYAKAYSELIASLSSDPALQTELQVALSVDTLLIVTPKRGGGDEVAVVTLPTHPLRMLWYAAYHQLLGEWERNLLTLKANDRKTVLDLDQLRSMSPANMPMFITHPLVDKPLLHSANLRFFYGIALPPMLEDPQRRLADLAVILGDRYGLEQHSDPSTLQLAAHIKHFRELHPYLRGLSITQINADRGDLLTESLARVFAQPDSTEEEEREAGDLPKLSIYAYVATEQTGTAQDVTELRRLVDDQVRFNGHAYLTPALSYVQRSLAVLKHETPPAAHLAIASDLMQPEPVALDRADQALLGSSFSFYGLICRLIPTFTPQGDRLYWQQHLIGDGVKADRHPIDKAFTDTLVSTQIQIAQASSRSLGGNADQRLGLCVELVPFQQKLLEQLHMHSSWVITIDRFFALDYYDMPHNPQLQHLARKYLIDYSPEFTDGIAHRLVVTTMWRDEIEELLRRAMDELGFAQLEQSVGKVLDALKLVSGQLALHVSDRNNNAAAAVGLGIVVRHLQQSGRLRNSILVPVDSAPQIFHRTLPGQPRSERRCDLALFSFKRGGVVEVTFIEVKWRRGAVPFESLASDMLIQMQSSAALVRACFFAEPDRVDGVLQRARLSNVLRFYLARAQRHDAVAPESVAPILEHLGKLERREVEFHPRYEGYIITPDNIPERMLHPQEATIIVRSIASLAEGFVLEHGLPARDRHAGGGSSMAHATPVEAPAAPAAPAAPMDGPVAHGSDRASPAPSVVSSVVNDPGLARSVTPVDSSEAHRTGVVSHTTPVDGATAVGSDPAFPTTPVTGSTTQAGSVNNPASPATPVDGPVPPTMISVELGTTDEQPIMWHPSVKGSPHLFIIGIPGQGKSVAISNVLSDVLTQHVAPLIFDFHGQFADKNGPLVRDHGLQILDAADGLPFNPFEVLIRNGKPDWRTNSQETAEVFAHVVELGGIQQDGLSQAIMDAYKIKGFHATMSADDLPELPTPSDVLHCIERREAQRKVKNLAARCRPLLEMDLFQPTLTPLSLRDEIRHGMVLDLHAIPSESVQMAAGAFVLRKLYREMFLWGEADRIRLVILLDEAHRLAKDKTLPKIMKEGRKYGIAVVVASQGMKDFHPDVLSTAGTKVLFRVNYPESRTLSKYIASPPNKRIDAIVEQLPVGQAFVQTPEMLFGRQVRMRPPVE
ncbi:TraM recognition domain-containing protein [Candidatus Chloroploca sp. M-50]|uniref:TraM recognition domain-containing protein n=1 Tax=Candidatus Chloroploca mongolica TaxID=2528176 RepID=A0ABS4DEV0_9CHLR|nr:TraM recognition domain-containing protein [Candidatus Chloroploca mongolica]MBP1467951.1 TraM recognition domain-containing protein [Candidatus Chloroploca mongolica]